MADERDRNQNQEEMGQTNDEEMVNSADGDEELAAGTVRYSRRCEVCDERLSEWSASSQAGFDDA